MAESTAPAPGASAMSETLCPGDDGDSSTDEDYLTPDSEEESTWLSGNLDGTVVNRTSTETDTDNDQYSSLPPFMPCETGRKPDYSSSSEDNRREKNAKNQQFTAIEVTLSQAKLLRLKAVQRKVMTSVPSFKLDKTNKKNILVKPLHHKKMKTVLTEDIRMEEFDVQDGDDDDLGIIGFLNTKERQREIVVDFHHGKLTIVYYKGTESESVILTSVQQLRNPQRIIQLSRRPVVGRFLEVSNNMQRFIQTFHYDGGCQAKLAFQKDCKNVPSLHVTCDRGQTQHVISRVEEHVLSLKHTDVKISLATGLFLQSVHGQCVVHRVEKQHHCLLTVESPAQRVQLRASYRDSVLLVCEGNMAFCDSPGVIILPLCEGQRDWPPAYKHILEREDISSNASNHARAIGPPPRTWLRIITVSHGVSERTIIVMHAPTLSNEEAFRRQLQDSCKTAIQKAIDICPHAEIVLPLTLVDSVPPKRSALPMLVAVIETICENFQSGILAKLYLDKTPQDAGEIFAEMNQQLLWRGWSVDLFFENIESVKGIVEFSKDESNTDAATVHLFGLKQDASDAIDEVCTISAPPRYTARAEEFKTAATQAVPGCSSKATRSKTIPNVEPSSSVSFGQESQQRLSCERLRSDFAKAANSTDARAKSNQGESILRYVHKPVFCHTLQESHTKSGIKVSVYKGDITKLPVDAIVSIANVNERPAHGGSMEHAISTAAGFKLAVEREEYTRKNGPLRVTEVVATTAGWLPCKKVLHAVGPRWSDYKDKALCQQHLVDTVYNCLRKAHSMQIVSLGIPAIISGIDGVGNKTCARMYLSALHTFDNACGRETRLRHIHFVDTRGDIISVIQRTFAQNTSASTQEARTAVSTCPDSIQKDSDSDTASSANWNCNKMSSRSGMEDVSPDLEPLLPITSTNLLSWQTAQETPLHDRQSPSGASLQEPVKEDCCICRENMTNPKTLNCGHRFCTDCVDRWLSLKSRCPVCFKIQGTLTGTQPQDGTMGMKFCGLNLQGFGGYGSLMIEYSFPEGKQNEEDPNQDRPYPAVSSKAYLPNTKDGRKVLSLLKIAFDRRLVFTFGYSLTSGEMGVIWNDIHHKTSRDSVHGYTDHNFLERMTLDLADNGVTEKDLTDIHKDFIDNPQKYCQAPLRGSSQIHLSHTSGTSAWRPQGAPQTTIL